jgi:ornithine carbamoyltransferase
MSTKAARSPYATKYHRDHSVTVWNCLTQSWHRCYTMSDALLATLSEPERSRVMRHLDMI